MAFRTNFVKVSNLPHSYSNGSELFNIFSSCGQVQDITAVDANTVIVSYAMRSQTDQAIFALNQINIGGNVVLLQKYDPRQDPQFYSNPAYQRLGQYIGKDYHVMNPNHFQPWSGTNGHSNMSSSLGATGLNFQSGASSNGVGTNNLVEDLIRDNTVPWNGKGEDKECTICLSDQDSTSLSLSKCGHTFHRACLEALIKSSSNTFIECPYCKTVYGTKMGNMPTTGRINHSIKSMALSGYENCGCFEIIFNFTPGIQGPEHPNPGQPFNCHSFPRTAYLPDNKDGEMALHGIYMAWNQRMLFTIGTSITTGMSNTITWNDIHMKTRPSGGQHGYPDPNYIMNLRDDLTVRGITEAAILEHMRKHPRLRTDGRMH